METTKDTFDFVNVNPSDLTNAKRVKITKGAENIVETFVSNIDLNLTPEEKNTLKTMILLNRNKDEKIKLTALKVAIKYLSKHFDFKEGFVFMKVVKKSVNSALVLEVMNSDIAYILKEIIKIHKVVEDNISKNYYAKVSYYTIIAEFLKGKLHECETCGKWTPVRFCSNECVHFDDLSDLDIDDADIDKISMKDFE